LGNQKITSVFEKYKEHNKTNEFPVNLYMCKECGLIQMEDSVPQDNMYKNNNYGYMSSISNTMRNHLKKYNEEIFTKIELKKNDIVLDIGSNDATFLHYYNKELRRIGVDPTGNQFKQFYEDLELLPDYFTKENVIEKYGNIKCKIITSICMFYDLPDPVEFAKDIYELLDDEGLWTCEQSYLLDMLKTNSLDTICHEHLEYYALTQIKKIADLASLKIVDIKFNSSNGGSFRIYFAKNKSNKYSECKELLSKILKEEEKHKIKDEKTYLNFVKNCNVELKKLTDFIKNVNNNGKKAYIYGASTKGNCILQYCDIGENLIKYAVERNPKKVGLCTNTGIEIIDEETMRKDPPEYLIVLPWHFKNEIIKREKKYLDNGGQLIFYFPNFEIISNKPKILITGCDGFISSYIKETYTDYCLYGITKTKKELEKNITKFFFDMNDSKELENVIKIVNPEIIIHLASISSSVEAFKNPIKTLENNGMLTAKLCDIILRNNREIKLFNASSSEIYKGHGIFTVDEEKNINNTLHLHPYSIAKIMGQNIVKFYRKTYKVHFSNGTLFTTQSDRKSNKFLLNKIANYIKEANYDEPLIVGLLNSYRNIIHPIDVANSIKVILNSNVGNDYNICNYNSYQIKDLVIKLFNKFNINLSEKRLMDSNIYFDIKTKKELLISKDLKNGLDNQIIDIRGYPHRLEKLGWKIKFNINDILNTF